MTAINPFGWFTEQGTPDPPRPLFLASHDGSHPDCPLCRFAEEFATNDGKPAPAVKVETASLLDSLRARVNIEPTQEDVDADRYPDWYLDL